MSTTTLSNMIVPEVFDAQISLRTMQQSIMMSSGIIRADAALATKLAGGGTTFNVPFYNDLDDTEADVGSDDPASFATPGNITTGRDIAIRNVRARGWSAMDLVRELAGTDPMKEITNKVAEYWARQNDAFAISCLRGLFADNVANDAGDMVNDISTDGAGAVTSAELFSMEAVLDAAQTAGDAKRSLQHLLMHSTVHNRLAQLDMIDFRPDSETKMWHSYYGDFRVHVSDNMPAIAGTNRTRYHTYLLGSNVLAWADKTMPNAVSVARDEAAGNGVGMETLWTRRQFILHPYGVKFTSSSMAGEFPTNTELRTAANWDRVYPERKQVRMALLITNG